MKQCIMLIMALMLCSLHLGAQEAVPNPPTRMITDYIKRGVSTPEINQKRYIITGGPGVGKTTIIKYLEEQGEAVIHEAAMDVIKCELEKGVSEPWIKVGFREKVIALQQERQLQASAKKADRVYCDRSPIDTMTFCLILQAEPTTELKNEVQKIIDEGFYQRTVFLIESLGFSEQNEVRCESLEESLIIHKKLKESYEKLGFRVVSIPPCSVEDRVEMMRSFLTEGGAVAQKITQVSQDFKNHCGTPLVGTEGLEVLKLQDQTCFFGIHKDMQRKLDFEEVRKHILQQLKLNPDTKIVQVIGDSGRFSNVGTVQGRQFLEKHLKDEQLILWGYTGKGKKEGSITCEVNQLVNDWLEQDPSRFKRALANVVDFHTTQAIREWECSIAEENQNFYLVYGNACFGDDIISSDYLTDMAICLEGGIQSFRQIVNFILRDIPTYGIYNLRGENNPDAYHEKLGQYLTYFSAGEFLYLLSEEVKSKGEITAQEVEQFKENYLNPKEGNKRHLFNPTRHDASTKQGLWNAAWEQFKEERLWLKLNLCHFDDVQ